jgi:hypothetical protein
VTRTPGGARGLGCWEYGGGASKQGVNAEIAENAEAAGKKQGRSREEAGKKQGRSREEADYGASRGV